MTTAERDRLLLDLVDTVASLRADVQALLAPQPATANEADATLLREIHRATSGLRFSVSDLITNSEVTTYGAGDVALHDAIRAAVDPLNSRSLGILLAQLEGHPIAGFIVRRGKKKGAGVPWRVESQK